MNRCPNTHRTKGYTLVELMVALFIFGLVMAGLVSFNYDTTRVMFDSVMRLDINRDMRMVSQRLMADINTADTFYLYRSFQTSDRTNTAGTQRLGADSSGDFIILVYSEPQPVTTGNVFITKLVGYFRKPETAGSASSFGPIYRFEINYADQTVRADSNPVESLIAGLSYSDTSAYTRILGKSSGNYTNGIFYNFRNNCVMVNANIYRGNLARNSTEVLRLMVSPH